MQVMVNSVGSESEPTSSTPLRFRTVQSEAHDVEWKLEDINEGLPTGNIYTTSRQRIVKPETLEETVREEPGLELNQLDAQAARDVGWRLEDIDGDSLAELPVQEGSDLRDGDKQVVLTFVTTCPYPCTFPALLHADKDGRFLLYVQAACACSIDALTSSDVASDAGHVNQGWMV